MKKIILLICAVALNFFSVCHAANITDQNPMILDTAGDVYLTIGGVTTDDMMYVMSAIWHKCVTKGQELVIVDGDNSNTIGYAKCIEDISVKVWDSDVCIENFKIGQIDSGELFILLNPWANSFKRCKEREIPVLK